MSKQNRATFKASMAALIVDNSTGIVTPSRHRTVETDSADSFSNLMDDPVITTVDTSLATLTLNMESERIRLFKGSASFGIAKTIAITNAASGGFGFFRITLTASVGITFPSNSLIWQQGGAVTGSPKVWTPLDAGTYEIEMTYDGANWVFKIYGPLQ